MNDWMSEENLKTKKWSNHILTALNLLPKTYVLLNFKMVDPGVSKENQ